MSAGAFLPPALQQAWEDMGVTVLQGYGATETGTGSSTTLTDHGLGTVGYAPEGIEMRLAADGEVQFRGPSLFKGYWQAPEKTAAALTPDGWYMTGDVGHFDAAGRLVLSGRKRDMIVLPNGFNVYPEDIENALRIAGLSDTVALETRPGRIEAIVLAPSATPVRAAGERLDFDPASPPAELRATLDAAIKAANQSLGANQHISGWRLWPESDFPRTHTLKVKRDLVRAWLVDGRALSGVPTAQRAECRCSACLAVRGVRRVGREPVKEDDVRADDAKDELRSRRQERAAARPAGEYTDGGRPPRRPRRSVRRGVDDDVAVVGIVRELDLDDRARRGGQQRALRRSKGPDRVGGLEALGARGRRSTACFVAAVLSPAGCGVDPSGGNVVRVVTGAQAATAERAIASDEPDRIAGSSRGPAERASTHEMEVEVVDRLAAPLADVGHDPVAGLGNPLGAGDLRRGAEDSAEHVRHHRPSACRPTRCGRAER